ncbi:MAG: O-antigen ligase family protein [Pseudomonadales bacterium]|nr:O-antigen ligase family protein [Pseudomonadales bacterium]
MAGITKQTLLFVQAVWQRHYALLCFIFFALLATTFSKDRAQSISVQLPLMAGLILYVCLVDVVNSSLRLQGVMFAVPLGLVGVTVLLMFSSMQVVVANPLATVKALNNLVFVVPNDVLALVVVMPLLLGSAWIGGWWLRIPVMGIVMLVLLLSENLQSRQAVLLLLVGVIAWFAMMWPRRTVPLALVLLGLTVLVDGYFGWRLLQKIFLFPRTYVWHTAWAMFLDRPWIGQGPGLFGDVYFLFLNKAGYVVDAVSDRRPMLWAHNLYLEQLAERGVGGLFALLLLLYASAHTAWRAWLRSENYPRQRGMAAGIFIAILVFALTGIAEASFSRIWVSVTLLVLAALAVAVDTVSSARAIRC